MVSPIITHSFNPAAKFHLVISVWSLFSLYSRPLSNLHVFPSQWFVSSNCFHLSSLGRWFICLLALTVLLAYLPREKARSYLAYCSDQFWQLSICKKLKWSWAWLHEPCMHFKVITKYFFHFWKHKTSVMIPIIDVCSSFLKPWIFKFHL